MNLSVLAVITASLLMLGTFAGGAIFTFNIPSALAQPSCENNGHNVLGIGKQQILKQSNRCIITENNAPPTGTPPPATGTLVIQKSCSSISRCGDLIFPIQVSGNNSSPSSFNIAQGASVPVMLGPGSFTVTETPDGFSPNFIGACKQIAPGSNSATGTISAGQALHCIILNQ